MTGVPSTPLESMTGVTIARQGRVAHYATSLDYVEGAQNRFQHVASLETIGRSFIAALGLLLVVMLIAGGRAISGPAMLTFSIWISLLGLLAVGAFLIVRARRPIAGRARS
jgi:hypothetical protein